MTFSGGFPAATGALARGVACEVCPAEGHLF